MIRPAEFEQELTRQIEAAFSSTPYPGDGNLVSHDCPECDDIAQAFRGKHWREIPLEFLLSHNAALSLFTVEAYRYFLPAYLLVSVVDYDKADILPEYVVYGLNPGTDASEVDRVKQRIQGFTPLQRGAISAFLQYVRTRSGPEDPLCEDIDAALRNLSELE